MAAVHRNSIADGLTITGMSVYNEDSLGKRIAWARKHVEWTDSAGLRHIGMDQHQFAKRLITQGTPTGVRHVYVSQLENNHCTPAFPMFLKIAEVTGVTGGFLLRETDEPYLEHRDVEYFSPEADAAAKYIDGAPADKRSELLNVVLGYSADGAEAMRLLNTMPLLERARMLAVLRVMAGAVQPAGGGKTGDTDAPPLATQRNEFAARLVENDRVSLGRNVVMA